MTSPDPTPPLTACLMVLRHAGHTPSPGCHGAIPSAWNILLPDGHSSPPSSLCSNITFSVKPTLTCGKPSPPEPPQPALFLLFFHSYHHLPTGHTLRITLGDCHPPPPSWNITPQGQESLSALVAQMPRRVSSPRQALNEYLLK